MSQNKRSYHNKLLELGIPKRVEGIVTKDLFELVQENDLKVANCIVCLLGTSYCYLINLTNRPYSLNRWSKRLSLAWSCKPVFLENHLKDAFLSFYHTLGSS